MTRWQKWETLNYEQDIRDHFNDEISYAEWQQVNNRITDHDELNSMSASGAVRYSGGKRAWV